MFYILTSESSNEAYTFVDEIFFAAAVFTFVSYPPTTLLFNRCDGMASLESSDSGFVSLKTAIRDIIVSASSKDAMSFRLTMQDNVGQLSDGTDDASFANFMNAALRR